MKTLYMLVRIDVPTDDIDEAYEILENVDYKFTDGGRHLETEIQAWGENPVDLV